MFARDSQTLRNKHHFVINVVAIDVFYCNWKNCLISNIVYRIIHPGLDKLFLIMA